MIRLHARIENEKALDFSDALSRFIPHALKKIRNRMREKMREPKSGRRYGSHIASAEGESPATRTGAYERSLQIVMKSSLEGALETSLGYPAILEPKRPMWLATVEEMLSELERDLVDFLNK